MQFNFLFIPHNLCERGLNICSFHLNIYVLSQHKNGLKATPQKRSADDMDTSESPVTKKLKKSPCKYGAECYQKSADHRANFYHPDKTPTKRVSKVQIRTTCHILINLIV